MSPIITTWYVVARGIPPLPPRGQTEGPDTCQKHPVVLRTRAVIKFSIAFSCHLRSFSQISVASGGSRVSQRIANPWGRQPIIWPIFPPKTAWKGRHLDPPLVAGVWLVWNCSRWWHTLYFRRDQRIGMAYQWKIACEVHYPLAVMGCVRGNQGKGPI